MLSKLLSAWKALDEWWEKRKQRKQDKQIEWESAVDWWIDLPTKDREEWLEVYSDEKWMSLREKIEESYASYMRNLTEEDI